MFKEMKFRVSGEAHARAVQEKLLSLGYRWGGAPHDVVRFAHIAAHLYTEGDGCLTYTTSRSQDFYECQSAPEYMLYRDELVPAGKVPVIDQDFSALEQRIAAWVAEGLNEVGTASTMPGTDAWTIAVFKASDVPVGTKLYAPR